MLGASPEGGSAGRAAFKAWQTEVRFLGELAHPNLVQLYGYCYDGDDWMLVYEFAPNRTLDHHLFPYKRGAPVLGFRERLKVMVGAASCLVYLHEECGTSVIYRDLKTANILLDHDFNAKLADFGLARDGPDFGCSHVSTEGVVGTLGYMAPEYIAKGHVSDKCDVFSFGVVLLEVVTGRRAEQDASLLSWAVGSIESAPDGWRRVVDPRLAPGSFPEKAMKQALKASLMCIKPEPRERPGMRTVLDTLRVAYAQTGGDTPAL